MRMCKRSAALWTLLRVPTGAATPALPRGPDPKRTFPDSLKGPSLKERHVIAGAGPAGLTVAWQLARRGEPSVVLEADPDYVGGLAKTVRYKGHRFDVGGHRFYSKSAEINNLWKEMLPTEFTQVPRLSRIYYDRTFFPYPIAVGPTLAGLGLVRSARMALSYLKARLFPRRMEMVDGAPGAELVTQGLSDLAAGRETAAACLVSIGAPRLQQLGLVVLNPLSQPEHRLYAMLAAADSDSAHSRYNGLVRRLVSFERALACGL